MGGEDTLKETALLSVAPLRAFGFVHSSGDVHLEMSVLELSIENGPEF
jgi:hypothetical protein